MRQAKRMLLTGLLAAGLLVAPAGQLARVSGIGAGPGLGPAVWTAYARPVDDAPGRQKGGKQRNEKPDTTATATFATGSTESTVTGTLTATTATATSAKASANVATATATTITVADHPGGARITATQVNEQPKTTSTAAAATTTRAVTSARATVTAKTATLTGQGGVAYRKIEGHSTGAPGALSEDNCQAWGENANAHYDAAQVYADEENYAAAAAETKAGEDVENKMLDWGCFIIEA